MNPQSLVRRGPTRAGPPASAPPADLGSVLARRTDRRSAGSMTAATATSTAPGARIGGQHALLSVSAALVGLISYTASLLMAHLMPAAEYAAFAAVVTLLTAVGVAAGAMVPLPLAAAVRAHPAGSPARRQAVAFAVAVSLLAAVLGAAVLAMVALSFAGPGVAAAAAAAGVAIFVIAPVWGVLQGRGWFTAYAAGSIGQVLLRVGFGVAAVVAGWGAAGAVTGFVVAAAVVVALTLRSIREEWAWRPSLLLVASRWAEAGPIAAAQLVLSLLAGLDVVLVAALTAGAPSAAEQAAGYQVIATLTKAPLYVATGAVLVSYPLLRAAAGVARDGLLRAALGSFARLAVPATAILATAPPALVALSLPAPLTDATRDLPWLALAGLGYATLTVVHLVLLGLGAERRCMAGLAPAAAVLVAGLVLGWRADAVHGVAVGAAVGSAIAAIGAVGLAARYVPRWERRDVLRALSMTGAAIAALIAARTVPAIWAAVAVAIMLPILARAVARPNGRHRRQSSETAQPAERRLRVLHMGFEDPAMPGSGGGSLRTHEINRRLFAHHDVDVTVLTTRYPGCRDRVQDGVHYVHVGVGSGRTRLGRVLGYIALLPFHTRRLPADLVVEDFFAPISTVAAPLWAGRPTLGVVQWLNAREKARQYHLPVHLVERFGVRRHDHLIAMSADLATQLRTMNPRAQITTIGNGVDPATFDTVPTVGEDVVFIGRLEIAQKGLDLLLQAWALAAPHQSGTLAIAGTGPDRDRLQSLAARLDIADRVRFVGWVSGPAKHDLLAAARLVVVPSRFETFGIVAVEALAAATPVLTFDIPCLREVVPSTCGRTVAPFDVAAFAAAITEMCADTDWLILAGQRGRTFARSFDWDALAMRQANTYTAILATRSRASITTEAK